MPPLNSGGKEGEEAVEGPVASAVRHAGSEVLFVLAPVPEETLDRIPDRRQFEERVHRFADEIGVPYIDFSHIDGLNTQMHFAGWHHLSREGVAVFLPVFLAELERRGYLPSSGAPRGDSR